MSERKRVVLETNTLVSGSLLVASLPGLAVRKAIVDDCLLMSEASLYELEDVLSRRNLTTM